MSIKIVLLALTDRVRGQSGEWRRVGRHCGEIVQLRRPMRPRLMFHVIDGRSHRRWRVHVRHRWEHGHRGWSAETDGWTHTTDNVYRSMIGPGLWMHHGGEGSLRWSEPEQRVDGASGREWRSHRRVEMHPVLLNTRHHLVRE